MVVMSQSESNQANILHLHCLELPCSCKFQYIMIMNHIKLDCFIWIHDVMKFTTAWQFGTMEMHNESNKPLARKSAQYLPVLRLKIDSLRMFQLIWNSDIALDIKVYMTDIFLFAWSNLHRILIWTSEKKFHIAFFHRVLAVQRREI